MGNIPAGSGSTKVFQTLKKIHLESGIRGLYRGFDFIIPLISGASILPTIPSAAVTFTVYEFSLKLLDHNN
jgi:hypothetical protein